MQWTLKATSLLKYGFWSTGIVTGVKIPTLQGLTLYWMSALQERHYFLWGGPLIFSRLLGF
jgi:hypothetical protein